jgi:hypothetical protein
LVDKISRAQLEKYLSKVIFSSLPLDENKFENFLGVFQLLGISGFVLTWKMETGETYFFSPVTSLYLPVITTVTNT